MNAHNQAETERALCTVIGCLDAWRRILPMPRTLSPFVLWQVWSGTYVSARGADDPKVWLLLLLWPKHPTRVRAFGKIKRAKAVEWFTRLDALAQREAGK